MVIIFFQTFKDQGELPPNWKNANTIPIFKKGDKSQVSNY